MGSPGNLPGWHHIHIPQRFTRSDLTCKAPERDAYKRQRPMPLIREYALLLAAIFVATYLIYGRKCTVREIHAC